MLAGKALVQSRLRLGGKTPLRPKSMDVQGRPVFEYMRPGTLIEVRFAVDLRTATATVLERKFGWQRTMIGFHRLHGYGGGKLYGAWAVAYDLTSAAMIVFGLTGVVLWHRLIKDRRLGWVLLTGAFLFTAATAVYLLVAR